jgi:CcmD family protein
MPDSYPSLFIGYAVIWAIMIVYLASLGRRVSRLESKLRHGDHSDHRES